jgi:hypothetical protein
MNKKKQNLALRSAASNLEIAICTVKLHVGAVCSDSVEERRFLWMMVLTFYLPIPSQISI